MSNYRDIVGFPDRASVIAFRVCLFVVSAYVLSCTFFSNNPFNINLQTISLDEFPLRQLAANKASVIIFLSPDCPMCQNYTLTLNQLNEKYKPSGIKFYGIFSGRNFSLQEIKKYKQQYKITFELLMDKKKQLSSLLKAGVTPEIVVLNNIGKIMYSGSIDNWLFELGQKRSVITENYLDDALQCIATNKEIKIKTTEAKGCLIE
ncbi:MAG: redoxin domain-containing protein [Bacteroidia bacterium]|nr:redoxin domain-containing protein [Bacteroidia bacterium]